MSQPNEQQLEHEAKERFVNDFWDGLSIEGKYEVLKFRYGNIVEENYQDWLSEQDHENN